MPKLHLLRHGIARREGTNPPLSDEGMLQMETEAAGMKRLRLTFDVIFTSPVRRAKQTALIVAEALGGAVPIEISEALAPGCRLSELGSLFDAHREARSILLVGHQPDMGRIAADLTGAQETLSLERGALCRLEVLGWPPRAPATLERVLGPDFLREQAGR